MKIKLSPAPELNFCGPAPLKNQFYELALSFAILWILPHPNRIWGGVRAARNAAHSTSSAYSDSGRPQKKSMGKSKKCALTVKQFSVATWHWQSEKKMFFTFFSHHSPMVGSRFQLLSVILLLLLPSFHLLPPHLSYPLLTSLITMRSLTHVSHMRS